MDNKKKYAEAFIKTFSVEEGALETLAYNGVQQWDSLGHMSLIAELEEAFGIQMETDDIIDFSSYRKGFELVSKYGVQF